MMKTRILGRTGLKVNVLGFGGIPIQRVNEDEAIQVVQRCYDLGMNYFDTARAYTVSEERIGKALEAVRNDVVLATKSGRRTKDAVLQELETSLINLRTDWIDIYQLHNISSSEVWEQVTSPNGALEALFHARDEGTIHHIGITSHNPTLLTEIVKDNIFETILIPYNYLATLPAEELLPLCRRMNVGTVIMKPFGGGAFSNIKTALKFLLGNQHVDVIVPGMQSLQEVDENVALASGSYALNVEERALIEQDRTELGSEYCRGCNYCQPCQQEIPISFVLRTETQFLKRMGWSPRLDQRLQHAKTTVPTCLHCGECESRCPYHLPISTLLPLKLTSLIKKLGTCEFSSKIG
jgi:predicted aldo/keto reductase-like oxidoreductase